MVPLYFYTLNCLPNLHSRTTDLSINIFHPFLSPHPWISVNARMEKCSSRQTPPLSSVCTDLRTQPLALPNLCQHKIYTGLPSHSVLTFPLEVKPSCYLLAVFRPKQQYPFLVCWPVMTCPAFLAMPSITKNHFQGCWLSTKVNFCFLYTFLSWRLTIGNSSICQLEINLLFSWVLH